MMNSNEGIYLDFFSGSATTAHAIMQLNAEDGGKRRHIMVQLPEPCDEKSEAFKAGYDPIEGSYDSSIFTAIKNEDEFGSAFPAKHHIYDYVFTDSKVEREFAEELDTNAEVKVYAKLPKGFAIPTPVGDYNPDWAIAFDSGKVRHVFFIAETKGSMSSLELREIEKARISCARKFFATITTNEVRYDVVNSYEKLMGLVK